MFEKERSEKIEDIAKLLTGSGEMIEKIRQFDWTKTPLGAIENWQQSLKTAVQIMLNSRYPMFVWWGTDLINLYNDGYAPVLGMRHPAGLGKPAKEVWNEIWHDLNPQVVAVMQDGLASWNEEVLLFMERKGFSEECYFTWSYSPIYDDAGNIGGLFCACTEDTQKVLSRRRLQTLRDLGERTLEEAQKIEEACRVACETLIQNPFDIPFAAIYLLDADGKTAYRRELTGIDANDKFVPQTLEVGTEEDIWKFNEILQTGRGQKFLEIEQNFGRLSAGAWRDDWIREAFIVPLAKSGAQEFPAGFLISGISPRLKFDDEYRSFLELAAGHIATAITNARALEEERKRAESLAELDRAKTEFFSNVSHEFRTPLTLMLGNLEEVLFKNGEIPNEQKEQIETAHRNSLRLLKLVNTLLDFSRIEAGRQSAAFEPLDLSSFTADLASNFRSAIEKAGLELKINCPPLSAPVFVDREMWEKIVLNLISNAFKFTFRGAIEISLSERDTSVELRIKDSGVGIPADQLKDVFKRFHRVRQTEGRTFEGTGIGLSLVQELVRQHQGEIDVESELGVGTIFTVSIRKGKNHIPTEQIKEKTIPSSISKIRADVFLNEVISEDEVSNLKIKNEEKVSQSRILLADDNQDMREYVRRLLETEGYLVTAVADGKAALEILQNVQNKLPDLILSDVMMPRIDGFQLLEAIRADKRTREIPLIMLSARAGEAAKVEGLQAGADDYLVKPFAAREMLARVKTNLEMAQLRRESAQRESEILESIGDCFIALDLDYRLIYFNRCAEDYFRMTRDEVLGKNLFEVFPAIKDSLFAEKYRQALETKEIVRFEAPSVIKESGWVAADIYPSENGLSIYFRDTTKRKKIEETLRESEERFRNMADHAPVMIWITEADGYCSYLSQSWYEFTGQTPETGLGFGWLKAVHPDDQQLSQDIFIAANENRESFRLEYRLRREDGEYIWAIDSAQPRFGTDGVFLGYIGSVIDITERKKTEEKLQASENQLRLVTDSIPALISYVDTDLRYRFVNQKYTDWFGVAAEEIINKPIVEIIGENALTKIMPKLRKALDGERVTYEQLMPYKTIGSRYVEINLVPDKEIENGYVKGYYAFVQDISERKQAEQDGDFLSGLSELIRTIYEEEKFIKTAIEKFGEYYGANRCFFAEIDESRNLWSVRNDFHQGLPSIAGEYPVLAYPLSILGELNSGQICVLNDTKTDLRTAQVYESGFKPLGLRSLIVVPLRRDGRWLANLLIADDNPRNWQQREINLLETSAERFLLAVEKLRYERVLRESEAHLNLTTEAAAIGTWQWNVKTNQIFWNDIQRKMWGYQPSDTPADYSEGARLVLPEDLPLVNSAIEKCLNGETNYDIEYRIKPFGTDEIRWIRSTGKAMFDESGKTVSIQGISLDITKRKETEEEIRQSEKRLKQLANTLPQLIWTCLPDGKCDFLSQQWVDYTGIEESKQLGFGWLEQLHPEDREKAFSAWNDAVKEGTDFMVEFRIRRHDGVYRSFYTRAVQLLNDKGEIVKWFGSNTDITERKEQEERLRDSEALLQGSIDALTKHIAVLDWQGKIINVNAAWRRFAEENSYAGNNYGIGTNYVEESAPILSANIEECNEYGLEAARGIQTLLSEKQSYFEMEYPCHSPTEKRWFLMRVTSFGTGENLHVVVAHENVTARKLAELEREQLLEREQELRVQAENANRLKDEFLATVSHELRTPLNAILGWSAMARKENAEFTTMQRALEVIERSARNQNQIISDILEVSRIITGKLRLNLETVELPQIVRSAVDVLRPAIEAKAIDLDIHLETGETTILGDSDRLQQIFWNLLSNAVKFTPEGGKIEVSLHRQPRFAEISVKDNGSGIEPEFLPFVFDRFRQADGKMNRKHGGLGLGLAIVRHLTELHGGQVSVESGGSKTGATFTVRLPLKPVQSKSAKTDSLLFDEGQPKESELTGNLPQKLNSLRVLVVDDEPNSLELAAFILTENGAEVFTATSVDEALKVFDNEKLDLLISDIGMPERDGYELIREIKERNDGQNRNIPTIALTAYAREIDEKKLLHAGYRAFLPKPLEPSRLVEIALELIKRN